MIRPYVRARWAVVALFGLGCAATLTYNGPFFDESIYITAGLRTLEGQGLSDGYLTWFAGTLFWPALAAIGWKLGGILGTRALAVVLGVVSLAAVGRAAANLFDEKVGFWATLILAINGPFVSLARLGVYDGLALACVAVSFWAITEMARTDHRRWLVVAAIGWAAAVLAKYPVGLMVLPLLSLVVILRSRRAPMDVTLFLFVAGAIGLSLYVPLRDQIGGFFTWRLENRPGFGVPLKVIAYALGYLSLAPAVLGVAGWVVAKGKRAVATLLLACLLIWPIYHLLAEDPVGTNKHVVFGFIFIAPLVGLALSRLWDVRAPLSLGKIATAVVAVSLGGLGLVQVGQADRAWPDLSSPAHLLAGRVQPGDRLLISEAWPFTLELYAQGRIDTPWDVYDQYRLTDEDPAPGICEYDWIVDTEGSYAWTEDTRAALSGCPNYVPVASHTSTVVNLGADLSYVAYPVRTTIWQSTTETR